MKIVVVDGATLNPGDLGWELLSSFGEYKVYPRTPKEETVQRCRNAEVVITNKVIFDAPTIQKLPELKYIGITATGYNVVDIEATDQRGIVVTNVPTYGTESVAQMTFALLLELARRTGYHSQTVYEGRWSRSENFCYWDYPQVELTSLTIGIIGCGRIGKAVARIADAFQMNVLGYDVEPVFNSAGNISRTDMDTLFVKSDVVSLHCPLTQENTGFINRFSLSLMKKTSFLINTSRGQLVNEQDLADALNEGRIAGAGLDVLSVEPPMPDNPLLKAKNCIITPHIAWATRTARQRLLEVTIDNIKAYLSGNPQNVVGKYGKDKRQIES